MASLATVGMLGAFSLVFLGVGVSLVRKGHETGRRTSRLTETDPTPTGQVGPGPVVLEGTATVAPGEGTVEAPFTGTEAVLARAEVTRLRDQEDPGRTFETVYEDERRVPFLVDDGSGGVRVEVPAGADLRLEEDRTEVTPGSEPDHLAAFAEREVGLSTQVSTGDRRRYDQSVAAPGETVLLAGEAVRRGGDVVVAGGERPESFVLSDLSREEIGSGGTIGAAIAYAFGAVSIVIGVAALALTALVLAG
jgi:hypothetical protein